MQPSRRRRDHRHHRVPHVLVTLVRVVLSVVHCWTMLVIVNVLVCDPCVIGPCGVSLLMVVLHWISSVIAYCLMVYLELQVFQCWQ